MGPGFESLRAYQWQRHLHYLLGVLSQAFFLQWVFLFSKYKDTNSGERVRLPAQGERKYAGKHLLMRACATNEVKSIPSAYGSAILIPSITFSLRLFFITIFT